MSEMIERAALAIEAKMDETSSGDYTYDQEGYRALARAAIEAMRQPTDEMDKAGVHAESFRSLGLLKVRHIWGDMIRAALGEQTPSDAL